MPSIALVAGTGTYNPKVHQLGSLLVRSGP
jgi:hypothetical protein